MDALQAWAAQLQWERLLELALVGLAAVLCITLHETCHGLAALLLGDPTARRMGRLSLNPMKHIDPMGLLLLVVARFGWAKPVPIDPRYFKNPKAGMAITALAGPAGNVLLCILATVLHTVFLVVRVAYEQAWAAYFAYFFNLVVVLSAGLAVFNLIPIPPLDGSKILFALLPEAAYWKLMRYERYVMPALMVLVLVGALDVPLNFLRNGLLTGLSVLAEWTMEAMGRIIS